MYQTKHIHYKIIFKQDGQSESMEYKAQGIVDYSHQTHISFETKDGVIDFIYDETTVTLKYGQSILRFSQHEDLWNNYQLPYGSVPLQTKLIVFEANEERIKMKYELHDQGGLISTAYLIMTLIPHSFSEGL